MSYLELAAVFVVLPLTGFIVAAAVCKALPRFQSYFTAFGAAYLSYFLLTLAIAYPDGMSSSPVLGLELGNSPVMLIIYIIFGIGFLTGCIGSDKLPVEKVKEKFR